MKVIRTHLDVSQNYITVAINDLAVGQALTRDLFIKKDDAFVIIIDMGTVLTPELLNKLTNHKTFYQLKHQKALSCTTLNKYIKHNQDDVKKTMNLFYNVNQEIFQKFSDSPKHAIDIKCLQKIVDNILLLLQNDNEFLKKVIPHFKNSQELSYHSIHVCIYALSLAHKLHFSFEKSEQLGLAAILHDVGKKKVDELIQNRRTLSVEELDKVHQHVKYSIDIIQQHGIHDPYIINAVMQHHERNDGSGYPNQLHAREISDFGAIMAIADMFDALTNARAYREGFNTFETFTMLLQEQKDNDTLKNDYLKVFLKLLQK